MGIKMESFEFYAILNMKMYSLVVASFFVFCVCGRSIYRPTREINIEQFNVDEYLQQFGYMTKPDPNSEAMNTIEDRMNSLRAFQEWHHLPVTGQLDEETVKLMNTPRCGVKDPPLTQGLAKPYRLGSKWYKTDLTYRIDNFTPDLYSGYTRHEIDRALKFWTDVANVRITETTGRADIMISFQSGYHGDPYPFDGPGGVLGHAWFPPGGICHFDEGETWVVNRTGADLFTIAAHEFGHILGLDHSSVWSALMYPYYRGYIPNYKISADDASAIIAHYGIATTTTMTTAETTLTTETTTPMTTTETTLTTETTTPMTTAETTLTTETTTPMTTTPTTTSTTTTPTSTTPTTTQLTTTMTNKTPTTTSTNITTPTKTTTTPTIITRPPARPTSITLPSICYLPYTAAVKLTNNEMLAFVNDESVLVIDDISGLQATRMAPTRYQGIPFKPDAAFYIANTGNTYFIRGRRLYEFNNLGHRLSKRWIPNGINAMPEQARAAFAVNSTEIYILGMTKVWKFDLNTKTVVSGSHLKISDVFQGIPNGINAAMIYDSSTVYFFKDLSYYIYDMDLKTVLGGPYESAPRFLKGDCVPLS